MTNLRTPRKGIKKGGTYRRNKTRSKSSRKPVSSPKKHTGGLRQDLTSIIDSAMAGKQPTIVNPQSKFVIVTYWWGQGNANKNTQVPCIAQLQDDYRTNVEEELWDEDQSEDYPELEEAKKELTQSKKASKSNPTDPILKKAAEESLKRAGVIMNDILQSQAFRKKMNDFSTKRYAETRANNSGRDPITFDEMIKMWEDHHHKLNCNYMAVKCDIDKTLYQKAINAKPYFIKKALDACPGRGVLYIDGDMFLNKYARIFDIPDTDLMLRGWNMDPRSEKEFKADGSTAKLCFDPYIVETSGGTMFFGNTPNAREILDIWDAESSLPKNEGKADDRIFSMVLTLQNWAIKSSIIQLPIEYLWLTTEYEKKTELLSVSDKCDPIIEHPACLTSEDTATGGLSSREYILSVSSGCSYVWPVLEILKKRNKPYNKSPPI